jgi:sigma-54-interacting transcriptional regulator
MESPTDLTAEAESPSDVHANGVRLPESWRRACLAQESLRQMGRPRVNTLLIGADDVVWRVLGTSLNLASPIVSWRPGQPLHLPDFTSVRTLVIRDLALMSGSEQVRLLEWLDRASGYVQVVCTSSDALLPLVEDGSFINALYYRLNTICIDLTD